MCSKSDGHERPLLYFISLGLGYFCFLIYLLPTILPKYILAKVIPLTPLLGLKSKSQQGDHISCPPVLFQDSLTVGAALSSVILFPTSIKVKSQMLKQRSLHACSLAQPHLPRSYL